MGDLLVTILSGGATGLLGTLFSGVSGYFKQKAAFAHEESMARLRLDEQKMEIEGKIQVTVEEGKIATALADAKLQESSYKHDKRAYIKGAVSSFWRGLLAMVDVIRGLMRPSITTYMMVLTTIMYLDVLRMVQGLDSMPPEFLLKVLEKIILMVIYVTTTCIFWWFGSRVKTIQPKL